MLEYRRDWSGRGALFPHWHGGRDDDMFQVCPCNYNYWSPMVPAHRSHGTRPGWGTEVGHADSWWIVSKWDLLLWPLSTLFSKIDKSNKTCNSYLQFLATECSFIMFYSIYWFPKMFNCTSYVVQCTEPINCPFTIRDKKGHSSGRYHVYRKLTFLDFNILHKIQIDNGVKNYNMTHSAKWANYK